MNFLVGNKTRYEKILDKKKSAIETSDCNYNLRDLTNCKNITQKPEKIVSKLKTCKKDDIYYDYLF